MREVIALDRPEWLRMRQALWPGSLSDHDADIQRYFQCGDDRLRTFVAEDGGQLVGFLELDHRKYAPGCSSSPVPFIEGWYVNPICVAVASGGRSSPRPNNGLAPKVSKRLRATRRLRTMEASRRMPRLAIGKLSVSCAFAVRSNG